MTKTASKDNVKVDPSIAMSFVAGGQNMMTIPATAVIPPPPATNRRPGMPPGITNARGTSGCLIRNTMTDTNIKTYMTR